MKAPEYLLVGTVSDGTRKYVVSEEGGLTDDPRLAGNVFSDYDDALTARGLVDALWGLLGLPRRPKFEIVERDAEIAAYIKRNQ